MTSDGDETTGPREKGRALGERRRARGSRASRAGIPDALTMAFRAEAHRQSLAVAQSAVEREDQNFIDAISE